MRTASAAVKSRRGSAGAGSPLAVYGVGGTPSTVSPWSSGRRRITIASGNPTTMAITPEENAVARQPNVCNDHAITGTEMPPSPRPIDIEESARTRKRLQLLNREQRLSDRYPDVRPFQRKKHLENP